ncbi:MAG: Gldg family protein, partial [Clostridia bacterium]|nr:Gldg family protein [Clostridia bacterium]
MFTLLKRELKSLILNPVVLAIITVLNLAPVITLAVYLNIMQEGTSYAGFENMLSLMALFFAVAIPVVTVLSMVKDKRSGNEDFLYAMPITKTTVALSKIFAQLTLFAIPTAVLAIFPLIFSMYGRINLLQAYLGILIFLAFELFIIAFSAMLALKTKKIWSALVIAYSTLVASFILGILSGLVKLLPFGTGFDKITVSILNELSIFKKLDVIAEELFDWTVLAFFLIGALVFIAVALIKVKKSMLTAFMSLLMVLAIGTTTLLLPYSARHIDINKSDIYSPDGVTKEYLRGVDEEITVYLIDPYTNQNSLYNVILRTVGAGKNIDLKIVNTAEDQEFLEKYGLEDQSRESLSYAMIIESDKRWRFINGEDYFCYYNSDKQQYLSASEFQNEYTYYASILSQYYQYYDSLSDEAKTALDTCEERLMSLENNTVTCIRLENAFAEAVAYVTADMIPTVYFLTGHGEEGTTVNPYDFKDMGILPENADMIVINSPSEDYSINELNTVIDYLDDGGKLYILIDESNYLMPNLMGFLSHYGLSIDASIIKETKDEKT